MAEQAFNAADLELKFAVKGAEKKEESATKVVEKEAATKEKLVTVFDPKRSNAISFMVAKLPPMATVKTGKIDSIANPHILNILFFSCCTNG